MKYRLLTIFISFVTILSINIGCTSTVNSAIVRSVSLGDTFTMILMQNGRLWACGINEMGQLGSDRAVYISNELTKVMDNVIAVSAGRGHAAIITRDHNLWVCGQLGTSIQTQGTAYDSSESYTPKKILSHVASVACGDNYVMAVKTDGSLWAWGCNDDGQLGDNTENDRLIPEKIMSDVKMVSAGTYNAMALKKDGSLWAWGASYQSENKDISIDEPSKVMEGVISIASGDVSSMAIKKDGSLWAWGRNDNGVLGNGTTVGETTPAKIMDNVKSVSVDSSHVMAIKSDGSLWGWGLNYIGQIGNNTTDDQFKPVKIMDNVQNVYLNEGRTIAIKTVGSLWAWGANYDGEFGDGTKNGSLIPKKIVIPITNEDVVLLNSQNKNQ